MPLVSHWPLHEDSGSTVYNMRQTDNGVTNGGVTQGAAGILNTTAYDFDATDDNVDTEYNADFSTNNFSVTAWVNLDRVASNIGHDNWIVNTYDGSTGWILYGIGSTDEWRWWVDDTTIDGGSQNVDEWQFLCGVRKGDTGILYQNGDVVATGSTSGKNADSGEGVRIGGRANDNSDTPDGTIADVRVYDHALTQQEVQYLYQVSNAANTTVTERRFSSPESIVSVDVTASMNGVSSFDLTVVGSPGRAGEESDTASVTGSGNYSLSFSNSHENYRIRCSFATSNVANAVRVSNITLNA